MGRPSQADEKSSFSKEPSKALEELMDVYGNLVVRTAYLYLKDKHLAEDISQEVFIRAFRYWKKFRGDSSVKTWIVRITINLCHDKMRLKRSFEEPIDPVEIRLSDDYSLEQEVLKRIDNSEILKHVMTMPIHYQEVLYLFYYLDLSTVEISDMTDDPEGTIRGRLFRARKLLGEKLEKEGLQV